MAITVDQYHTHLEAARSAMGSGDWAAAEVATMQAQAVLTGLPDSTINDQNVAWHTQMVSDMLASIRTAKRSAAASAIGSTFQTQKITYARP